MADSWVIFCLFFRQELEHLRSSIQTLEDKIKPAQAEPSSSRTTSPKNAVNAETSVEKEEVRDAGGKEEEKGHEELGTDRRKRHKAAMVIQRNWRKHRKRVGNYPQLQFKLLN